MEPASTKSYPERHEGGVTGAPPELQARRHQGLPGGRLASLQTLRAFAAWLVVFHHFMQAFFDFRCGNALSCFVANRGNVGVDLFFVVSGFVMVVTTHGRNVTPRAFAAKRLARIVPAYWIWTSVVALLALALPNGLYPYSSAARADVVKSFVLSILFIPHQNIAGLGLYPLLTVGWSLNYEMLFYAVFAASLVVQGPRQIVLAAVVLVVLSRFWPWRFPLAEFLHNKLIWEFLYGALLGLAYASGRLPMGRVAGWICVVLGLVLVAALPASERALYWGGGSLLVVYGVLCLENLAKRLPFLIRLGDLSYSTYLVQGVIPLVLRDVYFSIGQPELWPAFLLLTIILVYGLSVVSYDLVESRISPKLQRLLMGKSGS